jgi:hypothetical protein
MISDVLSEAIHKIKWYRTEFPDVYKDLDRELDRLLIEMIILRNKLDTVPK